MTLVVDEKHRVQLPKVTAGEKLELQFSNKGEMILSRVEELAEKKESRGPRFVLKNGKHVVELDRPIDMQALKEALDDFP